MARKKKPPTRSVTVRMPAAHYALLAQTADARGLDLSSLVNTLLADLMPGLARWLAEYHQGRPGGQRVGLAALGREDPRWLAGLLETLRKRKVIAGEGPLGVMLVEVEAALEMLKEESHGEGKKEPQASGPR